MPEWQQRTGSATHHSLAAPCRCCLCGRRRCPSCATFAVAGTRLADSLGRKSYRKCEGCTGDAGSGAQAAVPLRVRIDMISIQSAGACAAAAAGCPSLKQSLVAAIPSAALTTAAPAGRSFFERAAACVDCSRSGATTGRRFQRARTTTATSMVLAQSIQEFVGTGAERRHQRLSAAEIGVRLAEVAASVSAFGGLRSYRRDSSSHRGMWVPAVVDSPR